MAHWKYLPIIATINKDLLNKKMLLSIIVVLRQNFVNTFIRIAIFQNWNNIGSNVYVSTAVLLPIFLITKNWKKVTCITHYNDQSPKHTKFTKNEPETLHCCWIARTHISSLASFLLRNSEVLNILRCLEPYQAESEKKIFFRKISLSRKSSKVTKT